MRWRRAGDPASGDSNRPGILPENPGGRAVAEPATPRSHRDSQKLRTQSDVHRKRHGLPADPAPRLTARRVQDDDVECDPCRESHRSTARDVPGSRAAAAQHGGRDRGRRAVGQPEAGPAPLTRVGAAHGIHRTPLRPGSPRPRRMDHPGRTRDSPGQQVLVPDLAGWRRSRLPRLPATAYIAVAPDWVCEVISPSTARLDRAKKLRIYASEGVQHAWLVDPLARTVEVLRLESGRWTIVATHAGEALVRIEPFEEIEIEIGALWADAGDETDDASPGD